jgi:hypothetical protein
MGRIFYFSGQQWLGVADRPAHGHGMARANAAAPGAVAMVTIPIASSDRWRDADRRGPVTILEDRRPGGPPKRASAGRANMLAQEIFDF